MRGEWETEHSATYWPQVPLSLAELLSRSAGLLDRRSQGPNPIWELVLTTASYLLLSQPVCGTGLYNCLTFIFLWASYLHQIQPVHCQGYTLISSTGCTCYLRWCISYLTARPRVNMQQTFVCLYGVIFQPAAIKLLVCSVCLHTRQFVLFAAQASTYLRLIKIPLYSCTQIIHCLN